MTAAGVGKKMEGGTIRRESGGFLKRIESARAIEKLQQNRGN
jgi:hypothetical protein